MSGVLTSTTFDVGRPIAQHLDMVVGISVRIPPVGQALKSAFSGAQKDSNKQMCQYTRNAAFDDMVRQAKELGAHAVVGIRYDTAELQMPTGIPGTEVMCYGTAVMLA